MHACLLPVCPHVDLMMHYKYAVSLKLTSATAGCVLHQYLESINNRASEQVMERHSVAMLRSLFSWVFCMRASSAHAEHVVSQSGLIDRPNRARCLTVCCKALCF